MILRKYYDFDLSMEFRCFVKNDKVIGYNFIIAFTQRNLSYYEVLHDKDFIEKIKAEILLFH